MQKIIFLLFKKLKNTESAQLWWAGGLDYVEYFRSWDVSFSGRKNRTNALSNAFAENGLQVKKKWRDLKAPGNFYKS